MKALRLRYCSFQDNFTGRIITNPLQYRNDTVLLLRTRSKGLAPQLKLRAMVVEDDCELHHNDIVVVNPPHGCTVIFDTSVDSNSIILTEKCQFDCVMCPQGNREAEYSEGYLQRLISMIPRGTQYLGVTGGEPTLYKDRFLFVIKELKKRLPKTAIEVLTNGFNLSDHSFVTDIANIEHPELKFAVSLYADVAELHNRVVGVESFFEVIQGLINLYKHDFPIEIRFVINQYTYRRIVEFSEFIFRNLPFVHHVAFMGNEYTGMSKRHFKDIWIHPREYGSMLQEAVQYLAAVGMNVSIYNHPLCLLEPSIRTYARQSISEWKRHFYPICAQCVLLSLCGGVFKSSEKLLVGSITPVIKSN